MAKAEKQTKINYDDDTVKLAILSAQLADDKLALDTYVLDLRKIDIAPAEFFVICSTDSTSQSQAILSLILENSKNYRLLTPKTEGIESLEWVIVDFFDVVVHIMLKETRDFYKIEKLWGDSDFYKVNDEGEMLPIKYSDVINTYLNNNE